MIPSRPPTGGPLVRSLSPRAPRSAQLWAVGALVVSLLTNLLVQGLTSPDGTNTSTVVITTVVLVGAVVLLRLPAGRVAPWVVVVPLLGVAVIVALDLPSGDAGVTGQVFFIVPVIWAAAHLRVGGVILTTLAAVAGEAVVVFTLLPPGQAAVEFCYLTVLLVLVAGVLSRTAAQQERLVGQLQALATVDPLTGLLTRRVLDSETARLHGDPGARATLVVLDLDRFKTINDDHGHLGGDAALHHVATLLTGCSREGDVVARMGGDELAVLMPDCSGDDAVRRAQAFVDAVRDNPLHLPDGTVVPLSVSAGMAPLTASDSPAGDPYARADAALYAAKRAGRDRLVAAPAGP